MKSYPLSRGLLVALFVALGPAGCHDEPAPRPGPPPLMSLTEVQRGQEACKVYVEKLCACVATTPALKGRCELDRALPDALQVSIEVAEASDTKRLDSLQASSSARSIVKQCFEHLAQLPSRCQ